MQHTLPDELIRDILSTVLDVPDNVFSDTSRKSPFCRYTPSTSAVLLVCKRWLRIATPPLYHVVVLRSKAQAQALDATLRKNKEFGRFIKKLRLEGGYGASMHRILKLAPNVTDLFLSLVVWSSDSVSGLYRSLDSINPNRVILYDPGFDALKNNNAVRALVGVLCDCIKKWDKMKTFDYPYTFDDESRVTGDRIRSTALALSIAPSLETLYISGFNRQMPRYLHLISLNPSLRNIRIKRSFDSMPADFLHSINAHVRLQALFTFDAPACSVEERTVKPLFLPPRPTFTPMLSASDETKDHIWKRVLAFAMRIQYYEEVVYMQDLYVDKINTTRKTLLLVSKTFKRLALPYLYGYPILPGVSALKAFSERLVEDRSLGLHIRSLFIDTWSLTPDRFQDLLEIVSSTDGLVRLRSILSNHSLYDPAYLANSGLDWSGFLNLAARTGSSLVDFRGFKICGPTMPQSPSLLGVFTKIRSLDWDCSVKFHNSPTPISTQAFSTLEDLRLLHCSPSFLDLLAHMELPALQRVTCRFSGTGLETFLERHGEKIRELHFLNCPLVSIFDSCPMMSVLVLRTPTLNLDFAFFRCKAKHKALVKVVVMEPSMRNWETSWSNFFQSPDLMFFPALREIQMHSCEWPTTEHEISRSVWVKWAEHLLKWNIKLTDAAGKHWTPRLKLTRG